MQSMVCENPVCLKEFQIADELGGKTTRCSTCGGTACETVEGAIVEPHTLDELNSKAAKRPNAL